MWPVLAPAGVEIRTFIVLFFCGDSPVTASVQLPYQFFPAWRIAWQGLGKGKGVLDGCSVEGPEIELLKKTQTQTQTAAFRDSEKLQTLLSL